MSGRRKVMCGGGRVGGIALVMGCLLSIGMRPDGTAGTVYASHGGPHATVRIWDTAVPIPPSLSLGLTPGESVEDPLGATGHGTSFPTVVTVYARGTHPFGPSGVSYWNPDGNVFAWYGKTIGFPGGVDINRGGPVQPGGPLGTSFGPGDVWVGGQMNEPLYVHLAGTDIFRTYGASDPVNLGGRKAWGVEVDEASGHVFVAQPEEGRITRLDPPAALVTIWAFPGAPAYVTVDGLGRPYATLTAFDRIIRLDPGADGALGSDDDTLAAWSVPALPGTPSPSFRPVPPPPAAEENPNGLMTADADGSIWFVESNSHEVGRLDGGPDSVIGTADDVICEFAAPGLLNPQQIAVTGAATLLQAYFTEGLGNSVSVLTQAEADRAGAPARVCTTVGPEVFPITAIGSVRTVPVAFFDEQVPPLRTAIVPTLHEVSALGDDAAAPIMRFSPMPNPLLSADGTPIGDAGNGFPSGMTGVYATARVAGAYLDGNKHFELRSGAIVAPPPPPPAGTPGRMTGGGRMRATDGRRVTHGLVLHCAPGRERGKDVLQVNWDDGHTFHLERLISAACSDDPAIAPESPEAGFDTHAGRGAGRLDGREGATIEWTFTDAGEPGRADTARMVIRDALGREVLAVSGTLIQGNHQAHRGTPAGS